MASKLRVLTSPLNRLFWCLKVLSSVTIIAILINVNVHVQLTRFPFVGRDSHQEAERLLNSSFDVDLSAFTVAPKTDSKDMNFEPIYGGVRGAAAANEQEKQTPSPYEPRVPELSVPEEPPMLAGFDDPCYIDFSPYDFHCKGFSIKEIPQYLDAQASKLILQQVGITRIKRHSLARYSDSLIEFIMTEVPKLETIEPGAFRALGKLTTIQIRYAPKLISLNGVFTGYHPNLKIIKIRETGLKVFPDFSELVRKAPKNLDHDVFMEAIDLQGNQIATLGDKQLKLKTVFLRLANNLIGEIPNFIFNGSEIGSLDLSSNKELKTIHEFAFKGAMNMDTLILSETAIKSLPTDGLASLRKLIIQDTRSLVIIPTIYQFPQLESAALTYPFHCCAFHNPAQHDPKAHEAHKQKQAEIDQDCDNITYASFNQDQTFLPTTINFEEFENPRAPPPSNSLITSARKSISQQTGGDDNMVVVRCGMLANRFKDQQMLVNCTPEHDTLNPCEDIMSNNFLRHIIWLVLALAIFGNLAVIVVLGSIFRRLTVPRFLQLNLALGDLFTGVYLLMLASADYSSRGTYFNYAIDWQQGLGCKLAGSASLFASQLSIFTLSVITFERFFTITNTIDLNMRLKLSWASRIMLIGWLYAIGSALLPIWADISSYSVSSICLPLRTNSKADMVYVLTLISIKALAFFILMACYLRMYFLIVAQETEANFHERRVAKRMALLVLTDFVCYAPIIFFAVTALLDMPLISMTNTKYLVVFFYPLNAVANPFLYVISTRQYKRDLNYLGRRLSNWWGQLLHANQQGVYVAYGDMPNNIKLIQQPNNNNNNAQIVNRNQPPGLLLRLASPSAQNQSKNQIQNNNNGLPAGSSRFKRPSLDHFRFDLIAAEGARRKKMMKAQSLMDEKQNQRHICKRELQNNLGSRIPVPGGEAIIAPSSDKFGNDNNNNNNVQSEQRAQLGRSSCEPCGDCATRADLRDQPCETKIGGGAGCQNLSLPAIVVQRGVLGENEPQREDNLNYHDESKINKKQKSRSGPNAEERENDNYHPRRIDILGNLSLIEATTTTSTSHGQYSHAEQCDATRDFSKVDAGEPGPSDAGSDKCRRHRRIGSRTSVQSRGHDHHQHHHHHHSHHQNNRQQHHHHHHHRKNSAATKQHHYHRRSHINSADSGASKSEAPAAYCGHLRGSRRSLGLTRNQLDDERVDVGVPGGASQSSYSDASRRTHEKEEAVTAMVQMSRIENKRDNNQCQQQEQQNEHDSEQNGTFDWTLSTTLTPSTTPEMLTISDAKARISPSTDGDSRETLELIRRKASFQCSKCNEQTASHKQGGQLLVYSIDIADDEGINIATVHHEPTEINAETRPGGT